MTFEPELYPADIAPIARAMDRLAAADASAASADLEQRTVEAARSARSGPPLRLADAPASARPWWSRAPLRLAAAVAIVAAGGAAWMLTPAPAAPSHIPPSLEEQVDVWLAMADADDSIRTEIETLLLLNAGLTASFDSGWIEDDLLGESL
jgi:hypothetical protein